MTVLVFQKVYFLSSNWVQGWRSGEGTRLPPMWPRFDSQTRRHMWVEFVGSLLCTKRFSCYLVNFNLQFPRLVLYGARRLDT